MNKEQLKIRGFDFLVDLICLFITVVAYYLTLDIMTSIPENESMVGFVRGAFVFIAPCAIEGVNLLTLNEKEDKSQDLIGVVIALVSIACTICLLIMVFLNKDDYIMQIKYAIAVYPIKFLVNGVFDFIHLFKERKV